MFKRIQLVCCNLRLIQDKDGPTDRYESPNIRIGRNSYKKKKKKKREREREKMIRISKKQTQDRPR
jgi:hypothetical protein